MLTHGLNIIVNLSSVEAADEWQILANDSPEAEVVEGFFICSPQSPGSGGIREAARDAVCSTLLFSDAFRKSGQDTVCSTLMLTRESHGDEEEVFENYTAVLENEARTDE